MAADVSGLRTLVEERGRAIHAEAIVVIEERLDVVVPDSGEASPDKLREQRQVTDTTAGTTIGASVTYLGEKASWTEDGTEPHSIDSAPGGPALAFYWPKIGGWFYGRHVDHPGSTKHVGWFRNVLAEWPDALREALNRLS